ncbi:mucin-2-like isoform X1 [Macrobrachium nipponense]|uniref:mucin-2-like isoform X1 n=1 Tax=Macrobrachium nipponense TaxID=159736 RepID=UPI0030C82239
MSTEARASPSGGRDSVESLPTQPYPPHFYPAPNYQGGPQPPWIPGQLPPGVSGPWPPPWAYPGPPPGWSPTASGGKISPHSSTVPMPSDEYTVDTMRRIYNDDDGRIEIQRVKVQRRQPEGSAAVMFPPPGDPKSLVPVGSFPLNEKRPPPRKNKMKRQMELMKSLQGQQGSYPWYPYMPCMPYPYPYPYYYGGGCVWPGGMPPPPLTPWPGSDDSERTTSRQESLPATLDSQRLESRVSVTSNNSHSPIFQRSPSPAATTHSIAPSDSISVCGYKAEDSMSFSIRGPTPPPRRSRGPTDKKLRAIMAPSDDVSDAGDKISIITTSTDIVPYQKPPRRKRKSKMASISDVSYLDQKDIDSLSDRSSIASEITCDDSRLNSELSYAFQKFEKSVDVFKSKVSVESTPVNTPPRSPSPIILHSKDTAVSAEDNTTIPQSEDTVGEDTDTYIVNNTDSLQDKQPSTVSYSSLPPLETVPSDSTSLSVTTKEETAQEVSKSQQETNSQKVLTTASEDTTSTLVKPTDGNLIPVEGTDTTSTTAADIPIKTASQSIHETVASTTESNAMTSNIPYTSSSDTTVPSLSTSTDNSQLQTDTKETKEKDSSQPTLAGKLEVTEAELDASSGRDSRLSSSTFFSIRPSDDPLHLDTDSTDILLPTTDATTADEGGEGTDWTASSPVAEDTESYQWVLQQPGEIPDLTCSTADREDERRNAWRAEVSLWRARLVVSLCRGRGLDRQDWATFHLLVHHPLTLDLKLSILHAPRLCVANSTTGAALVRVALIHLAQYGETLLQPEASRQLGWRSIKVDPNQSWAPVKGAVEILKALGYQEREENVLRYPRRSKTEVSVLARLTLDMLVLAEELRLYLTGTHQYPTNISDLFFPSSVPSSKPSDGSQILQDLPRPPSSTGSYSYMSAQSNTSLNHRPSSQASSVTDEETETLQVSVKQAKAKKIKQPSSSDEEVTLKEDLVNKSETTKESSKVDISSNEKAEENSSNAEILIENKNLHAPEKAEAADMPSLLVQSTTSLDMSSLPDLQSIRSSTTSLINPSTKEPDKDTSVTPATTPIPDTPKGSEETKDNPEEHIYEEIDVIRQQVQALRASSVPVDTPPPLPPKKKVSSGGEDDSGLSLTYPHMEWTSASMPGSLRGGSTGARRKKRRAPMPPDFMPPDWKPYENRPRDDEQGKVEKSTNDSKRSLNPFYEDIDSVKSQVKELNKDYENKVKAKQLKNDDGNPFEKDEYIISGYVGKNPFYEDIEEEDTEKPKIVSRSAASTPLNNTPGLCPMGSLLELQDESILIKAKRKAPRPPSTDPSSRTATPQPQKSTSPQPPKHPPTVPPPRPPSSPPPPRPPSSPIPKHPPTTPPPKPPLSQEQLGTKTDMTSQTTNSIKDNKTEEIKNEKEKTKARNIVGNAIKASLQKLQIQHPNIPPPPPPPKLDDEDDGLPNITTDHAASQNPSQPTPSLFDDIPYMDAHDLNVDKEMKKPDPAPQYEIPELPGKDGIPPAPPLSPTTLRQTALLLRGHRSVPFIDESDLPPDCPPPPPPTSPPDSTTETPKASPPETPHTSPPETPKTSRPGTPCTSSPSSPITITQVATDSVAEPSLNSPLKGENIETLKITVHIRDPNKEGMSDMTENSQINIMNEETNTTKNETKIETVSTQSKLPQDTAQKEPATKITEDPCVPPPLPPKAGTSQNSNDDPYANQSVTSSRSGEKSDFLESSKQADKVSTTSEETTAKLEPLEEQQNDETSSKPLQQENEQEERYEIPEVIRETALSIGPEGMPVRVGGPAQSHRMDLESVFGPPKPPKRRNKNSSLPPPRPPKSLALESTGLPKLPPKAPIPARPASASTTSSFVTASAGSPSPAETPTSFQGTPRPTLTKQRSKTRRSWPLLFCDCMYANCKNYDEINK